MSHTFWQVIFGMILGIFMVLIYANRARFLDHSHPHFGHDVDLMGGIKTAIDSYQIDNGYYPSNFNDLIIKSAATTNWHGPYLDRIPTDPRGNKYIYEFPGKHNTNSYDLMSLGPDGKRGTDDDIGNWTTQ